MSQYAYEHGPLALAREKLEKGFSVDEVGMKAIKYRWEFLRRNEDYIDDYEKSLRAIEGFSMLAISSTGFEDLGFCKKWRLGVPLPPEKTFNQLNQEVKKKVTDLPKFYFEDIAVRVDKKQFAKLFLHSMLMPYDYFLSPVRGWESFMFYDEHLIITSKNEQHARFAKHGEVNLTIDFNYSQTGIKKEFEAVVKMFGNMYRCLKKEQINYCQKLEGEIEKYERNVPKTKKAINKTSESSYKEKKAELRNLKKVIKSRKEAEHKIKRQKVIPRTKKQFDNYDDYLKTWDLYKKDMKWKQIAQEVLPGDDSYDGGKRKVIQYKKEAESLIKEMALGFTVFTRTEPYSF